MTDFVAARAILNTGLHWHTVHSDIVDVLEILVCQVYTRFDNGDGSILIAHVCASKGQRCVLNLKNYNKMKLPQ